MICKGCGWDSGDIEILDYKYYNGWVCPACDTYNITVYDVSPIPLAPYYIRDKQQQTEILRALYESEGKDLNIHTGLANVRDKDWVMCEPTRMEITLFRELWEQWNDSDASGWLEVLPHMCEGTAQELEKYAAQYTNGLTWARFLLIIRKDKQLHPKYGEWRV